MAMEIIPMEKMFFCSPTHCHIKSQHTHFSPYRIRIKNRQSLTTMHNAPDPACTAHEEAMKPKVCSYSYTYLVQVLQYIMETRRLTDIEGVLSPGIWTKI
eukprot:248602_1